MSFLYRYECKGIQDWILRSQKLTDIRGASNIIEGIGALARCQVKEEEVIMATAGVGLLRFASNERLAQFASEWPMRVAAEAPGLTLAHAWGDEASGLQAVIDRVGAARNLPRVTLPEAAPIARRAGRSGEPAVDGEVGRAEGVEWMDAGLKAVRGTGGIRRDLLKRFSSPEEPEDDLERWQDGYAAVVHIDGNRMGRAITAVPPKELKEFSAGLENATKTAAGDAVSAAWRAWKKSPGNRGRFPFRPLVLGGDDVTVLLHGRLALPFVRAFLHAFERETASLQSFVKTVPSQPCFTAKAGIAYVKRTFPFAQANRLAEELCKAAGPPAEAPARSRVLFHRVTTSSVRTWENIRREELAEVLAGGPYALEGGRDLDGLADLVRLLRAHKLPRGPMREWVGLRRDEAVAELARLDVDRESTGSPSTSMPEWRTAAFVRSDKRWERILHVLEVTSPGLSKRLHDHLRRSDGGDPKRPGEAPTTTLFDALTLIGLDATELT